MKSFSDVAGCSNTHAPDMRSLVSNTGRDCDGEGVREQYQECHGKGVREQHRTCDSEGERGHHKETVSLRVRV